MKRSVLLLVIPLMVFVSCTKGYREYNSDSEFSDSVMKWAYIFDPSVFSWNERLRELQWFEYVSQDLKGITVLSTAENIETHYWESQFLSKAFEEITGIRVDHKIQPEGNLVRDIMDQIENNNYHYDIYVNDTDMIGTHLRMGSVVNLSAYMEREGWQFTDPYLDLDDFLNLSMGQDYNKNQLQLPDQQFANLYWFRYDWFTRKDIKQLFKDQYGYELGVPLNWSAYEDIAEFFNNTRIDGKRVYGHIDYGKPSPSLGWRFTDSWLAMAGVGDPGIPNGLPVDDWGIRVENYVPVGSTTGRGGATDSPAAIYALKKYLEWLNKYAPAEARQWEWSDAGTRASEGDVAQRIFQYTTWLSDPSFHRPSSPVTDIDGSPKWRLAPSPHGKYWDPGMKSGYQDCGSWTIPKGITGKKRAAAWLWAQFCVSKSVSLKKYLIGGTPVRFSTVNSAYITKRMESYGGLIEFYRSKAQKSWTSSSLNVPYYSSMSQLWWKNIAESIRGVSSPEETMSKIANEQDELMSRLQLPLFSPEIEHSLGEDYWLNQNGSPKPEITDEPLPQTVSYEKLLREWRNEL
ncbi:ABC transporter substrate-binding protein [Spirochaeta isovalerica]|uniref:Glycerol transport system substrate-binding protein n=1 Tax=Spirochaeta isovalerica TaxID=150 RepID=A0A841R4H8_9SPIO|nr:extracellular solute-binding protein [Spirochaeta isovalerica]MBB6478716.1 glycerol transport system substrate-binding protein [Spirochaeta isovalerica]